MPHCPICGIDLVSESCLDARCQQVELAIEQAERELVHA